jgi:hypothetical protein
VFVCVGKGGGGEGALPLGEGQDAIRGCACRCSNPASTWYICAHVELITSIFVAEHGSDVWWAASIEELLPAEVSKTLGCN